MTIPAKRRSRAGDPDAITRQPTTGVDARSWNASCSAPLDSKEQHFIDGCVPGHFYVLLFNVLHHAEVDFDTALVPYKQALQGYIQGFMKALRP